MSQMPAASSLPTPVRDTFFLKIQPWLVVFSAALFFFFEFMQVNMFNALDPSLFKAFHLTDATQLGQLSACYMYANVIFLLPAGMIIDRVSTRKIILLSMASCVSCAFLFSFTTALWQAELCRLITGIGGSFCLLSCVRLASRWFPPKRMALVVGLIVTFAMIGGMMAQTPFTLMTDKLGWKMTLRIDAAVGLAMLLIIFTFVRDYPKGTESAFKKLHATLESIGFWKTLKRTISNPQNWLGGLYASLINLPIFLLGATWGELYLVQAQHLSRPDASLITSMIFVGMIIGSPVIGWISDKINQRKMPMIVGAVASLAVILAIMYVPNLTFNDLMFLFFALGFVISAQIIAYPLVAESNPSTLTASSEGLASVLIMGGGFSIPLFPALLNLDWNHLIHNGVPTYNALDYHIAFMIMPVAFALGLVISFFVKETHCKSYEATQSKHATVDQLQQAALVNQEVTAT